MLVQTLRRVRRSSLSILLGLGFLSSCVHASGTWTQMGSAVDGNIANAQLGFYVALSYNGTRMAIGMPKVGKGDVGVYDFIDGEWELMPPPAGLSSTLTIPGTNSGDEFGKQLSISADGTRLAIAGPMHDGSFANSGHVQVYDYSGGSWSKLGGDIEGQAAEDKLEKVSLSADGTRVAVGTIWNSNKRGNTRVFEYSYDTSDWILMDSDENRLAGEAEEDFSAGHVALSSDGTRVAISSYTANVDKSGHVRVFEYDESESVPRWRQMGTNINGEAASAKLGEHSVAISADGTRLIAGAFAYTSESKVERGRARVYEFSNGDWQPLGSPFDGEARDWLGRFGASISADGTRVAISSIKSDVAGTDAGLLRLYEYNETVSDWVQMDPDIYGLSAQDKFGNSASLSGDGYCVAAGARQKTINSKLLAGQVRAFQFPRPPPAPVPPAPEPPAPLPPCTCCEKMAIDYGFTTSRACAPQ